MPRVLTLKMNYEGFQELGHQLLAASNIAERARRACICHGDEFQRYSDALPIVRNLDTAVRRMVNEATFQAAVMIGFKLAQGQPQPRPYLRAWAGKKGYGTFQIAQLRGRAVLRFPNINTDLELLDYVQSDDDFFVIVRRQTTTNQFEAVFYRRGEYRHKDLAVCC